MIQVDTKSFVLAGSGEPGLLLAGLAIADELQAIVPHSRFIFAGAGAAEECRIVCRAGYEYVAFGRSAESRRSRIFRWPWAARGEPRRLLQRIQPAAVVALGGTMGESVGRASVGLGFPLAVLEPRITASRATRRLAATARVVCLGFEETRQQLDARCPARVTGIPLARPRCEAAVQDAAVAQAALQACSTARAGRLVILGGGTPRHELSAALPRAIGQLQQHVPGWRVVHRTHGGDVRALQWVYRRLGVDAVATGHIHNLPSLLNRSELVIAATPPADIMELAASTAPIVAAIQGHSPSCERVRTALSLGRRGACVVVDKPDCELAWTRVLEPLLQDHTYRRQLAATMTQQLRTDAAWQIASIIRDIVSSPAWYGVPHPPDSRALCFAANSARSSG